MGASDQTFQILTLSPGSSGLEIGEVNQFLAQLFIHYLFSIKKKRKLGEDGGPESREKKEVYRIF